MKVIPIHEQQIKDMLLLCKNTERFLKKAAAAYQAHGMGNGYHIYDLLNYNMRSFCESKNYKEATFENNPTLKTILQQQAELLILSWRMCEGNRARFNYHREYRETHRPIDVLDYHAIRIMLEKQKITPALLKKAYKAISMDNDDVLLMQLIALSKSDARNPVPRICRNWLNPNKEEIGMLIYRTLYGCLSSQDVLMGLEKPLREMEWNMLDLEEKIDANGNTRVRLSDFIYDTLQSKLDELVEKRRL